MAAKKVIAICQSGGEFVTSADGSMSYNGGEAYAIHIDQQTTLADFKSEVAETFSFSVDNMLIKYFLPGNKKTLITVAKDKDLKRMLNFLGEAPTADMYIMTEGDIARYVSNMRYSRSSGITVSESEAPLVATAASDPEDYMAYEIVDMEIPNEATPINCYPGGSSEESQRKAAQQWANIITGVGQRFNSFNEFRDALHKFSIGRAFAFRYKKNDNDRVSAKCKSQGCPWRIYASKLSKTQLVCIKTMEAQHTCEGTSVVKAGYRATKGWVGNHIKEKLKVNPNYKPKDIVADIEREYGIKLEYSQARRAKEVAMEQLQGSYKEAYSQVPFFCEKIKETNPGSVATFATKDDSSFHSLFVSFRASICGFEQGCRPLLFLDTAALNSKYGGVLLAATAVDAEDGIFPLAFAVVDAETEDNWRWFLQELKGILSPSRQITFVSDVQNGLKMALAEKFDGCYHSYCVRHIAEKINRDLKGLLSYEARIFLVNDIYAAAQAPKLEDFQQSTENIKGICPDAYDRVLESEPEHWANAFFPGARYNHIRADFGKDFYSWVSEANELPITQMIDSLRVRMMESMYIRRVESNQWVTKLTPSNEEKLEKEILRAQSLQVSLVQDNVFEVRGGECVESLNLDDWDCSCKVWRLTGLPCSHAIAVFEVIGRLPYDYCAQYFTSESYRLAYAESILPVPNADMAVKVESSEIAVVVSPPAATKGRSKAKEADVFKRQLQCSKCKGLGHNKKTCKEP